jgi:hypothetical protein
MAKWKHWAHSKPSVDFVVIHTGPTPYHRYCGLSVTLGQLKVIDNIPSEKQWARPMASAIWLSRSTGSIRCHRPHGSTESHGPFRTFDNTFLRNNGPTPCHRYYDPAPTLGPFKVIDHIFCKSNRPTPCHRHHA